MLVGGDQDVGLGLDLNAFGAAFFRHLAALRPPKAPCGWPGIAR